METYLVIGCSGYIGSQISTQLKEAGHKVIGTYANNKTTALNLTEYAYHLDLTSDESIDEFCATIGDTTLDGLIFSHSVLEREILDDSKKTQLMAQGGLAYFHDYVRVNSESLFKVVKKLLENLKKGSNPNIIFLGSLVGKKALNSPIPFSVGKSCLNGLVESLSKELGQFAVKVNSVDPGMLEDGVSKSICNEDRSDYLTHCGLSRFGTAQEVAKVCKWMVTKNTYITGKPIILDGAL